MNNDLKRMKKTTAILATTLIMLTGCAGEKQSTDEYSTTHITAFETNGTLSAKVKKIPASIAIIRGMFISGDFLLLYKQKDTTFFDLFKLPDCTYLGSSGNVGNGPNDFIFPDPRSFTPIDSGFTVLEAGSHLLKTVKVKENRLVVTNIEKTVEKKAATNGFYALSDQKYVSFGNIGSENEFTIFDKKRNESIEIGKYPTWVTTNENKPHEKFVAYLKNCVVHPDGEKFAAFYVRFKRFRIFNDSGDILHDINVKIEPYSNNIEKEYNDQWSYYVGTPQCVGNYIYALCINQKGKEKTKNNMCELQIWSWDGKPIACYKLDKHVSFFSISNKHNTLFAFDTDMENEIYCYELPTIK